MKHIKKQSEPQEFIDWKSQANENWQPTWTNFGGTVKNIVKESLLKEQGYICCYCGVRIENDNATIIEHLYPRESCETEERKLDYQNLLASCNGNQKSIFYEVEEDGETLESIANKYDKAKWEIEMANIEENLDYKNLKKGTIVKITEKEQDLLHCDASKKAQILPINPLQEDCEIHFEYKTNGEIKITEQNKETIKVLNLNNKLLVDNRKAILDGILSSVQALQSLRLSKEGLTQHIILLKEQFSKKDENGKYRSYSFVITSYLEQNFLKHK